MQSIKRQKGNDAHYVFALPCCVSLEIMLTLRREAHIQGNSIRHRHPWQARPSLGHLSTTSVNWSRIKEFFFLFIYSPGLVRPCGTHLSSLSLFPFLFLHPDDAIVLTHLKVSHFLSLFPFPSPFSLLCPVPFPFFLFLSFDRSSRTRCRGTASVNSCPRGHHVLISFSFSFFSLHRILTHITHKYERSGLPHCH